MEARIVALKRAMDGCERTRRASVPGSAKARAASVQRDVLGHEIAMLARFFCPEGMSDDEEEDAAGVATEAR